MNDYIRHITENSVIKIKPEPIFVIKSKLLSEPRDKLFINVCHSENVLAPTKPFDPLSTYNDIMNNEWEIPIVTSPSRIDTDKKGNQCVVFDCIINSSLVDTILNVNNIQLREILVEWCIESVEIRENTMIHRDLIKFPKMKFKGDSLPELEIRNDQDDKPVEKDEHSVGGFLQMKRDLLDNDDITDKEIGLKSLFPNKPTTHDETKKSSILIEDISNTKTSNISNSKIEILQKKDVKFSVVMRKTNDTSKYKLRIEITSEIDSSLDLSLAYDDQNNVLLLKNINLVSFNEKELVLPLPNFVTEMKLTVTDFKSFYIKKNKILYIFI